MPRSVGEVAQIFGISLMTIELEAIDANVLRRVRRSAVAALILAVTIGVVALVGWMAGEPDLRSVVPGRTQMNPLTALTLLAASVAIGLRIDPDGRTRQMVSRGLAAATLVVGLVTLYGYWVGSNVGLDRILFSDQLGENRIAPNTGVAFVILGAAILTLDWGRSLRMRPTEALALAVVLLALNAILGYLYDATALYGWAQYIPMALPTGAAFFCLAFAVLLVRPQVGIMALLVSSTLGGRLARRLLPATLVGISLLGYARLLGERAGWYDVGFGTAVLVVLVILLLATLIVLTARSLSKAELARREKDLAHAHLAAIVESAEDAILGKTLDGTITSWNRGAERLYGYTADEIVGRPIQILLPADRANEEQALLARVARGETVQHMRTVRRRKDGSLVDVSISVSPIRDPTGAIVAASGIARDITTERQAEEQLRAAREAAESATRAKSAFLANMSHEIRTPLNAVIGMSGLLQDTSLTEEQSEYAETIRLSSEHLLTIINDILDFSKIESGKLELERHAFHIIDCLEEAVELVAAPARQKMLELAYSIEPAVPEWFLGDVGRVRQILVNLLGNGVKFTEEGGVTVAVGGRPSDAGRYELAISVRDTGIGIPEDKQRALFQSFSQADASMSRRYGGTGLGLAITRQLVEMMGGKIGVESEPGKGTSFHLTLVLEVAPAPEASVSQPLRELQGARLLVVDDNVANRKLLTVLSERWGMVPRVTPDPREALAWLEGPDPFDVAVLDFHMPSMDGVSLAARIRSLPHRAQLPLVLLTSTGGGGDPDQMARARFARILYKPARQSHLRDAVLSAINPSHERVRRVDAGRAVPPSALRVLLAEDNPTNQLVATKMLRKLGVEPRIVTNGQEAVAEVERGEYDLVFMDVQMPVLDGLEATRRICAKLPRGRRPKIVAMTAEALHGDRERCLAAGMDDYVTKPVRLAELERVLKQVATGS